MLNFYKIILFKVPYKIINAAFVTTCHSQTPPQSDRCAVTFCDGNNAVKFNAFKRTASGIYLA